MMDFRDEVRVTYALDDYEYSPTRVIRGIILDENSMFYTIAKIERKIIIGKRYIVKVEDVNQNKGLPPDFKLGRV
jgi:hypothetical protein